MGSWPWCAALETFGWEGRSISELFADTVHVTAGGGRLPGCLFPKIP